ncbi:hypothetical protein ABL78_8334 [Leptomonas seymouri]|uniref:Uncharacterized protein n=1 Tax=Leptomonas seymouri TaxID=5684 RepID=A0A0N1IG42_LEPSE|nr:hypothetical protein ABL78_8334 [Leptomonas seymouri]|eukprot:KPI82653.1 hypothetical protein ABL78_8334 [Leptomonas seymouri]
MLTAFAKQRGMSSGGSKPSSSAKKRKNRQITSNFAHRNVRTRKNRDDFCVRVIKVKTGGPGARVVVDVMGEPVTAPISASTAFDAVVVAVPAKATVPSAALGAVGVTSMAVMWMKCIKVASTTA